MTALGWALQQSDTKIKPEKSWLDARLAAFDFSTFCALQETGIEIRYSPAYFASIGKDMANSIPDIPEFKEHVKYKWQHTIQIKPLEIEEVRDIMKNQQPKMTNI